MQKFCRSICKANNLRQRSDIPIALTAPEDWGEFFRNQLEPGAEDWFQKLLRGPQERGKKRNSWQLDHGVTVDVYGLMLTAISKTGPKLTLTKDEINSKAAELTKGEFGKLPQTARVLGHMSRIAETRIKEDAPRFTESGDELEDSSMNAETAEVQPVLEFVDDGPNSKLYIVDPFFAFYLRWGATGHFG